MKYILNTLILFLFVSGQLFAQFDHFHFTQKDYLRGKLSEKRSCFDVQHYDLELDVNTDDFYINGKNTITAVAVDDFSEMQLDFFENMTLNKVVWKGEEQKTKRLHNAFFIKMSETVEKGDTFQLEVFYEGKPQKAILPPWDGGVIDTVDQNGDKWFAYSCQGMGASSWWPLKDHPSDEPNNGVDMKITIDDNPKLFAVSNGQLVKIDKNRTQKKRTFHWRVSYPINHYNVTFYIGNYERFSDNYELEEGVLDLNYYVINGNSDTAKVHFEQVKGMLKCYEGLLGEYPFVKDGFALVEAPYWGMEHQSAVAYGNHYNNNIFDFDFIIIHESGHEYFGNSVSTHDNGALWLHEALTTYLEALYVECRFDHQTMIDYLLSQKFKIKNALPINGLLDVNFKDFPDADMYYKGSWMMHTLRNIVNNDLLWFEILYDWHQDNKYSIVTTEDFIKFMEEKTKMQLRPFFDVYLNTTEIPQLQYDVKQTRKGVKLKYRFSNVKGDFAYPIKVSLGAGAIALNVNNQWQESIFKEISLKEFKFMEDYYLIDFKSIK